MQSVNVSGGAATEAIISGLTRETIYTIEVAAINSAGIGKYSLSMTAITSSKSAWYQPVSLDWVHSVAICTLYFILVYIRESVDSLCRDGADTPIVRVHRKAFLTRERSRSKPFWAPNYSIPVVLYPTIPPK